MAEEYILSRTAAEIDRKLQNAAELKTITQAEYDQLPETDANTLYMLSDVDEESLVIDETPIQGSSNPVSSGGVYEAITNVQTEVDGKSDVGHEHEQYLTEIPSEYVTDSELTAKGYATTSALSDLQTEVNGKQDTLTFDSSPKSGSTNPVTSGGVYNAVTGLQGDLQTVSDGIPTEPADLGLSTETWSFVLEDERTVFKEMPVISSITIITFTIDGTAYQAEEGMTWGEWVESGYNTLAYVINAYHQYVTDNSAYPLIHQNGNYAYSNTIINNGDIYTVPNAGLA